MLNKMWNETVIHMKNDLNHGPLPLAVCPVWTVWNFLPLLRSLAYFKVKEKEKIKNSTVFILKPVQYPYKIVSQTITSDVDTIRIKLKSFSQKKKDNKEHNFIPSY